MKKSKDSYKIFLSNRNYLENNDLLRIFVSDSSIFIILRLF